MNQTSSPVDDDMACEVPPRDEKNSKIFHIIMLAMWGYASGSILGMLHSIIGMMSLYNTLWYNFIVGMVAVPVAIAFIFCLYAIKISAFNFAVYDEAT